MNQMTGIEENTKALKRQSILNQAPQLPPGGTRLEQRKPFVHYLEIETGKVLHVTGSGQRQVAKRRCNPSRAAAVAAPVGEIHGERISSLDLFPPRTGKAKGRGTSSTKCGVASQGLSAGAAQRHDLMISHAFTHAK